MARVKTTISMYRGDSYPITLTLKDSASGAVIDLTGASLLMTVDAKENPTDATTKIFSVNGVIADPATGVVQFTPTSANTATIGTYYYDVQLTDAEGNVRTVAKNTFTISQDITK